MFERDGRVRLGRCGSRRSVALFRTLGACFDCLDGPSLLPTRPVWAGRAKIAPIRAYLPRRHRTVTVARMRRGWHGHIGIKQTTTRIFVTIRDRRVYWLPAPQ